jgi:hypothetical protein
MSRQFNNYLVNLEKRVNRLETNIKRWPKQEIVRDLRVCHSFLSQLSTYAIVNDVDLDDYRDRISEIHASLLDIQEEIERKPWYKKAVGLLKAIVRAVCDLLGVPSLGKYLAPPDDDDPPLLN